MKTIIMTLALAGSAVFAMVSCTTPSGGPTAAVACPKCETVWVNAGASGGRGNPVVLKSAGHMSCPDCADIASPMLKGLTSTKHTCKSCGTALIHCKS